MTDQELRSAWLDTRTRLERIEKQLNSDNGSRFNCNRRTSLDNLINRYKTFACISFCMPICMLGWFKSDHISTPYNLIIPCMMAVYFYIAALMDIYLMRGLKRINLNTMSVSTVCSLVSKYKRIHHICMIVLIPICIIIIELILTAFISNTYMIAGVIAGALVGLAIGIVQYHRFMSDYKILSED